MVCVFTCLEKVCQFSQSLPAPGVVLYRRSILGRETIIFSWWVFPDVNLAAGRDHKVANLSAASP